MIPCVHVRQRELLRQWAPQGSRLAGPLRPLAPPPHPLHLMTGCLAVGLNPRLAARQWLMHGCRYHVRLFGRCLQCLVALPFLAMLGCLALAYNAWLLCHCLQSPAVWPLWCPPAHAKSGAGSRAVAAGRAQELWCGSWPAELLPGCGRDGGQRRQAPSVQPRECPGVGAP